MAGKTEINKITETDEDGVKTEREVKVVYDKIIGHENIIKIVERYLSGWEYSVKFDDEPPDQLMLALLGPPGLGKSFIAAHSCMPYLILGNENSLSFASCTEYRR